MKKSLLTACCVLVLGTLQVKAQLVAHYTFSNLSGTDATGNNLNAQMINTLTDTIDHNGMANEAVRFANQLNSAFFIVNHNSLLNFTNQLSITVWIKPAELVGSHKIVDKLNVDNTGNFELDIYDETLRFWVASGEVEVPFSSLPLINPPLNTWLHIVAVYDGTNAKIYVNGALAAENPVSGNCVTNASDMYIGHEQNGSIVSAPFLGAMDDLKIYGNALSNTEILALYNQATISKWSFNNGNANDEIGTDNGTVNGATLTTDRFGNANHAYAFDGVDDEIDFDGSSIDAADFSISFWVKTPTHNYKTIIQKWATGNGGFAIEDYPNLRSMIYTNNSGITRSIMLSAISTGNWHHIVLTNGLNDSASLYIDGNLIGTDVTSFSGQTITGGARLFLGATNANTNNFAGSIDDLLIYNYVISPVEVNALYTEGGWGSTTGIDELSSGNVVNVYPNPANRVLDIEVKEATTINVVNLFGATVYTQKLISGNNSLDVSNLTNGVYFIQSDQGGTVKFVKE